MKEQLDFINTCTANNKSSQRKIDALGNWPWELVEKAAYYTAIAATNTGIESASLCRLPCYGKYNRRCGGNISQ